jgi:hypothetical protein
MCLNVRSGVAANGWLKDVTPKEMEVTNAIEKHPFGLISNSFFACYLSEINTKIKDATHQNGVKFARCNSDKIF